MVIPLLVERTTNVCIVCYCAMLCNVLRIMRTFVWCVFVAFARRRPSNKWLGVLRSCELCTCSTHTHKYTHKSRQMGQVSSSQHAAAVAAASSSFRTRCTHAYARILVYETARDSIGCMPLQRRSAACGAMLNEDDKHAAHLYCASFSPFCARFHTRATLATCKAYSHLGFGHLRRETEALCVCGRERIGHAITTATGRPIAHR